MRGEYENVDYAEYSSCVTATCRSLKMMFGTIPSTNASASIGSTTIKYRRLISDVNDRYCE